MNKVKLQTNDIMPQIVAASEYKESVNELLSKILLITSYYVVSKDMLAIKGFIHDFIERHKEEV